MPEHQETLLLKRSHIVIHWTDGKTETFTITNEKTRIGRGKSGNTIAIPDIFQSVSREHVEIRREKEGYRLIDLGSRNGTLVNNIYAKDIFLKNGDEIRIGQDEDGQQIRIIFQLGNEAIVAGLAAVDESATLPPNMHLSSDAPIGTPYFKIHWHNGHTNYYRVDKNSIIIGRGAEADIRVPETMQFVSGTQAEVLKKETGYFIRDLSSTNGTYVNNQLLQPEQLYPIGNESIVRMGDDKYGISIGLTFYNPTVSSAAVEGLIQAVQATQIAHLETLLIGRLESCDMVLDSPEVSRRHAILRKTGDAYFIEDLNSSNGTYVNNQRIKQVQLLDGDLIQISNFRLLFQNGMLAPYQVSGMRLDVSNLSKDIKKRRVLDNIHLTILPREFVAIVDGSNMERSTLLNTLVGFHRGSGEVLLNGHNFYEEIEALRPQLGYVPRSDILHPNLTVETALDYAAQLRLPSNLAPEERRRRIDSVLDTVSMNTEVIRNSRIDSLTDGQRKRVSIAAELLADPKLIYLDEAADDLDPGLGKKMMHTLRRLADEGRTVILITRATDNIMHTDHVAFLSEGKLVYFGPSDETLSFFEVDEFADIYERIDHRGDEWRQVFQEKKNEHYQKYIQHRQANTSSAPKRELPKVNFGVADFFHQVQVLLQRSLSVLVNDRVTLSLLLLLFPVTAMLQLIIAKPDILTGNPAILADPVTAAKTMLASYMPFPHTNAFVFAMGLGAVLTGLFLPLNDLIQERSIYVRERMINLKALAYLLNKVIIYSVFVMIQALLYLFILSLGIDYPQKGLYFNGTLELFITLYLTMMAGIALGLVISAVSRSTKMAIHIFTILLLFQFFFAGAVFDLRGSRLEPLSYLTTTRWSLTAIGTTIGMDDIAESTVLCSESENTCFHYPEAADDLRLNYDDGQLLRSWMALIVISLLFLTGTWLLIRRMDSA